MQNQVDPPEPVRSLLPQDKFDTDAVARLAKAGYPTIGPILDELVDWTADRNWPVARPLASFLIGLGEPLIEPLSRVLRGHDFSQKEHCIRLIVSQLPDELVRQLEGDLRRLAEHPTAGERVEEVDVAARDVLVKIAP